MKLKNLFESSKQIIEFGNSDIGYAITNLPADITKSQWDELMKISYGSSPDWIWDCRAVANVEVFDNEYTKFVTWNELVEKFPTLRDFEFLCSEDSYNSNDDFED